MNRSLLVFQNSLKSDVSVANYTRHLDLFMNFVSSEMNVELDYDSLSAIPIPRIQILVEDYIMMLKKKLSPNSIPSYYYPIQSFFESNDVDLRWKKIRKLFPQKVKVSGDKPYSNNDIKKMLEVTPQLRNKVIIHFLASTGCRLGALPDLQLKHLSNMPFGCKSVLIYEDSIEEYYSFLTTEASNSLDEYLDMRKNDGEFLSDSSPVFRNKYLIGNSPVKKMSIKSIQNVVSRAVLKSGIRGTIKRNNRYEKQTDHAFRKRFNTILKLNNDVNSNIIEKMLGHKKGLDNVYLKPTKEQMFEEFVKGIAQLTINPEQRQQYEIKKQEEKINSLQITQKEKVKQEEKMNDMEERLNFLSDSQFAMISTIQEIYKTDKKTMKKFISTFEKDLKNISEFDPSEYKSS